MSAVRNPRRTAALLSALAGLALACGGCGLPGSGSDAEVDPDSVFQIEPGNCYIAPTEVQAQIDDLKKVDCTEPHDLEAYLKPVYTSTDPEADDSVYPGDDALTAFAKGACAQGFQDYVGVDYLNSSLYFTYLLPSPRSWEQSDRSVICLLTTTGRQVTGSLKDSKR